MSNIEFTDKTVSFSDLASAVERDDYAKAIRLTRVRITGDEEMSFRFSRALRGHPTLKEFSMEDVKCEDGSITHLSQVVSMILITVPHLEILKAEKTELTSAALTTVGYCPTIKMLILPNNELTDKDASTIADALAASHSLQLLDLRGNKMTDAGCALFASAIGKNMTLASILLDENVCSEKGIGQISGAIQARSAMAA